MVTMILLLLLGLSQEQIVVSNGNVILKNAINISAFEFRTDAEVTRGEDWEDPLYLWHNGDYIAGAALDSDGPIGLTGDIVIAHYRGVLRISAAQIADSDGVLSTPAIFYSEPRKALPKPVPR